MCSESAARHQTFRSAVLVVLSTAILVAAAGAAAERARPVTARSDSRAAVGRLVGTWEFQVTFRNCDTADPLGPPFTSIHTYLPGGSALEQGSRVGAPPATSRSVGQGVWERTGGGEFQAQFIFWAFDATGQTLSRVVIDEEIEFEGGDSVFSFGVGRVFNPQGQQIAANCFTSPGQRVRLAD